MEQIKIGFTGGRPGGQSYDIGKTWRDEQERRKKERNWLLTWAVRPYLCVIVIYLFMKPKKTFQVKVCQSDF